MKKMTHSMEENPELSPHRHSYDSDYRPAVVEMMLMSCCRMVPAKGILVHSPPKHLCPERF